MGWWIFGVIVGLIVLLAIYDLFQTKHAILRNFPVLGHMRYLLEKIGPELRQYIVANNDEERPFSRDQRRWVYASSKKQNNYFGFGTDNDLELTANYLIIKHSAFPKNDIKDPSYRLPCAKVLGEFRQRSKAFRPESVIGISAMSYGSLSAPAVEAINRGCAIAGALHNTGEGGIAPHHDHGGGLIWQLGTGYFGACSAAGVFDMARFKDGCASHDVRAVEVKLSQGAKPGRGGVLPAAKVTPEIAKIRGVPLGVDVISPPSHTEFSSADEMLDFIESLADATGLPIGIKSAVGQFGFWEELADLLAADKGRAMDYIAIDGGEGGTGAAPLVFSDRVSLPFNLGFARVHKLFAERGVADRLVWMGAGKLGFPDRALLGFGLGCDMVMVAREAMLAVGCIQAQQCHTGHCPTGVATQNKWLMRGLDPTHKASRMANYLTTFRKEMLWLVHALGLEHPSEVSLDHFEIVDECFGSRSPRELFGYAAEWESAYTAVGASGRELMEAIRQSAHG